MNLNYCCLACGMSPQNSPSHVETLSQLAWWYVLSPCSHVCMPHTLLMNCMHNVERWVCSSALLECEPSMKRFKDRKSKKRKTCILVSGTAKVCFNIIKVTGCQYRMEKFFGGQFTDTVFSSHCEMMSLWWRPDSPACGSSSCSRRVLI